MADQHPVLYNKRLHSDLPQASLTVLGGCDMSEEGEICWRGCSDHQGVSGAVTRLRG